MTADRDGAVQTAPADFRRPWIEVATERRQGETIALAPEERRSMPAGGIRVLMLGPSVSTLVIQGLLLRDLPAVARLDLAGAGGALETVVRRPHAYDLALVVARQDWSDAAAFARALQARLGAAGASAPGPFVVALSERRSPGAPCDDTCAACMLLPLTHDRFAALLGGLFRG